MQQTELTIEETRNSIKSEITNAVSNLEEYQRRALNMKVNMDVAKELSGLSIAQLKEKNISVQDILQIIDRQKETELNFLEAYLGYRESLLRLLVNTHYDYEKNISLIDQFRAQKDYNISSINHLNLHLHDQNTDINKSIVTAETGTASFYK